MTTQTTTLERLLLDDLDVEGERAADDRFCTELYRALANNVWETRATPRAGSARASSARSG